MDRVAVITGASRGVGGATALLLADKRFRLRRLSGSDTGRNVGREVLPKLRYDLPALAASSVVVPFKQVSGPVKAGLNLSASTSSPIALSPCPPTTASEKQVSRWLCSMTRLVRSNADCTAEICFITSTQ